MTEEKFYICDKCGEKFRNQIDCLACEDGHLKISKVTVAEYGYRCSIPSKIEVELTDGYRVGYERRGPAYLPSEEDGT